MGERYSRGMSGDTSLRDLRHGLGDLKTTQFPLHVARALSGLLSQVLYFWAVKEMSFASPMKIGDTLCIYTHIVRVGRTSMTLKVEAWAQRYLSHVMEKVTDADFIMVALDAEGRPMPVPPEE